MLLNTEMHRTPRSGTWPVAIAKVSDLIIFVHVHTVQTSDDDVASCPPASLDSTIR